MKRVYSKNINMDECTSIKVPSGLKKSDSFRLSIEIVLYIGLTILLFNRCGKDFLETKPGNSIGLNDYFTKPEEVRMLTRSMYGGDWFLYLEKPSYLIGEVLSGNAFTDDGSFLPFSNGTLSSDNGFLGNGWNSAYGIITRANQNMRNLRNLEVEPGSDMEEAKNITIGESRFFRAYAYSLLLNYWGAIPVVMDNAAEYTDIRKSRVVTEDVFEVIIRDLTDAIAKLPESASQPYLTKLSAKALLAKVYLTRAGMSYGSDNDFTLAKDLAKEVIDNASDAGYGLLADYHDLWLLNSNLNKETLYSWQWNFTTAWSDNYGLQNSLQSYFAPSDFTASWDGWSSIVPSIDLINSWEPGDLRRYNTIMEDSNVYPEFWKDEGGYTYNAFTCNYGGPTKTLTNIRKHLAGKDNSSDGKIAEMYTECYTPIIRLADVYLTYVEAVLAKNASTSDGTAMNYLNILRVRAGLSEKTSITYRELFNERRHEFAFEFQNWDDILRYYRLYPQEVKTMLLDQERGWYTVDAESNITLVSSKLPTITDNYFVLPIPSNETLIDPLLLEDPVRFDFANYL
jgi:starch-binding outer membrane protein, SusD/RagB family